MSMLRRYHREKKNGVEICDAVVLEHFPESLNRGIERSRWRGN